MGIEKWVPADILDRYEVLNYNHAAEILAESFPEEYRDVLQALRELKVSKEEIMQPGGNKSPIPPKIERILGPRGWKEIKISGDLNIKFYPRVGKKGHFANEHTDEKLIRNYIDGHNIDHVKGRVAVDVERNSKDQTFDRELFAMRTYYECDVISVGVIITRSENLNDVFRELDLMEKYGASTTWMGKLVPRLDSRRHGGCPILAVGITKACVFD